MSLQTPHSGYHWRREDLFFEGWYFRLTLPRSQVSFAFMYSLENPSGAAVYQGGAVQILGPGDRLVCRTLPQVSRFWASSRELALGYWQKTDLALRPQFLAPESFDTHIQAGYQVSATHHQGQFHFPTERFPCRWFYQIRPDYGWGNAKGPQRATAGWLSYLPIFEPGWQVLMALGRATGWIEWQGKKYQFENAPAYAEKNWGQSFPSRWFWLQANAFTSMPDLAVTAAGGRRLILGITEDVAMVGIHYQGRFYEFVPGHATLHWRVSPWGHWWLRAENSQHWVEILGHTEQAGTWVYTPTRQGLQPICRDTTAGHLQLTLGQQGGKVILQAKTEQAGLEIGGGPWDQAWEKSAARS